MGKVSATTADAFRLMMEGSVALAQVEANGMAIDTAYLDRAIRRTEWKISQLEDSLRDSEVYRIWRREYGLSANLDSRPQLAHVLFDVMGVPSAGYTAKTSGEDFEGKRRHRTDKMAFTEVDHPFCRAYEELAEQRNLHGTFLTGLRRETMNGFVHPNVSLNLVMTYRSSCNSPNAQNQHNRHPVLGPFLRRCYVPREDDWVLVEPDFGAVEVRGIAVATGDPELKRRLEDPHKEWACKALFLEPHQVDKKTHRDWSKNRVVFPKFYGSTYRKIAAHLWQEAAKPVHKAPGDPTRSLKDHLADNGVTRGLGTAKDPAPGTFMHHVRGVEEEFDKLFRVSRDCREEWYEDYKRKGYFDHLTGFREEGLFSFNDVINHRIQGMAFHWLLWSLIRIQEEFRRRKMRALIIMEIHDCLLIDCPLSEVQDVLEICHRVMTEDIREHWSWIDVPLLVEVDVTEPRASGGSWASKMPWVRAANGLWSPKAA